MVCFRTGIIQTLNTRFGVQDGTHQHLVKGFGSDLFSIGSRRLRDGVCKILQFQRFGVSAAYVLLRRTFNGTNRRQRYSASISCFGAAAPAIKTLNFFTSSSSLAT